LPKSHLNETDYKTENSDMDSGSFCRYIFKLEIGCFRVITILRGLVVQLGERLVRNEEVGGSTPLQSTFKLKIENEKYPPKTDPPLAEKVAI
jgi:hypothetical protein